MDKLRTVTHVNNETTIHTDLRTGEAVSETKTSASVIKFPSEPPFVKMYVQDLCGIVGVEAADQSLLRHLLARLDYDGYVTLSPRSKANIADQLSISIKTFRNRLSKLSKAGLIQSTSLNEYQVNPKYFARGNWKTICEQRTKYELRISYTDAGREIEGHEVEDQSGDSHKQQELLG